MYVFTIINFELNVIWFNACTRHELGNKMPTLCRPSIHHYRRAHLLFSVYSYDKTFT